MRVEEEGVVVLLFEGFLIVTDCQVDLLLKCLKSAIILILYLFFL